MTCLQARVLVIAGPPAAGKSTVAQLLALGAERPTVHVPTDCLHTWIRSGFVLPFLPESAHQNDVVQRVMLAITGAYTGGGYEVVLDGVLGPWAVEGLRAGAARLGLDLSYAVLRPTLDVILARAKAREGRCLRDVEPIIGLARAFDDLEEWEGHVIDSTNLSVEETTRRVADDWGRGALSLVSSRAGAAALEPTARHRAARLAPLVTSDGINIAATSILDGSD